MDMQSRNDSIRCLRAALVAALVATLMAPLAHAQGDGHKSVPGYWSHIKEGGEFYEIRYIRRTGKVRIRWRHESDTDTKPWGKLKSVGGNVVSYHVYHQMGRDPKAVPPADMCDFGSKEIELSADARELEFDADLWDRGNGRSIGGVLSVMVEIARDRFPRWSTTWSRKCEYIYGQINFGKFKVLQVWDKKPKSWPHTPKMMKLIKTDIGYGNKSKYELRIRREAVED